MKYLTFLIYYKDYKITDIDERHLLNTYIKNNYSFDKFKMGMQSVFDTVKREACVL